MGSHIFVRLVSLPKAVHAVTIPNDDSTFDVYVNSNMPEEQQRRWLHHEIRHINMDHFYNEDPVWLNEQEAG